MMFLNIPADRMSSTDKKKRAPFGYPPLFGYALIRA